MGFKQISQFTYFDYVVGITIGSIAAEMSFDREIPYHYPVIAMVIYALIALGFSVVTIKSIKARRYLNGSPVVLIDKGEILDRNMKTCLLYTSSSCSSKREISFRQSPSLSSTSPWASSIIRSSSMPRASRIS